MEDLNKFHSDIKCSHEVNKKSIHFLNLNVRLSDGKILIDLCVKPIDRHQSLYYKSSQPGHTKRFIVFSQALRVSRVCSQKAYFFKHLEKIKSYFLIRGYPTDLIEAEMKKN